MNEATNQGGLGVLAIAVAGLLISREINVAYLRAPERRPERIAWDCYAVVRALMISPSSTKVLKASVVEGSDNSAKVIVSVDSMNGFGTPLRKTASCRMVDITDYGGDVDAVVFDGETVPAYDLLMAEVGVPLDSSLYPPREIKDALKR